MQKHLQLFVLGLWHSYREVVFDLYLQNTFAFCTSNHLTFALCTSTHLTLTFWSINNRMSGKLSTCRVDLSLTCIWAVLVQTWVVFELYKHDLYLWCTNTKKSLKRLVNLIQLWAALYIFDSYMSWAVLWGERFVRSTFGIHCTAVCRPLGFTVLKVKVSCIWIELSCIL